MKIRLVLLLSVIAASLGLNPRAGTSVAAACTSGDRQLLREATARLGHQRAGSVLRWLDRQSAVSSALLGADGKTVDIHFTDGARAAILPASMATVRLPVASLHPRAQPRSPAGSPQGKALLMEPFATQLGLGPNAGDIEVADLQAAGYQVDQLYDSHVTVSSMATMSNYNVVYIHTHSGTNAGGDGVVATGQPVNNDPSVEPLVQSGEVIATTVSGDPNGQYYGIVSSYIQNRVGQFAPNALMFLNGCNMLSAPVFWRALQSKGLATLVSWDHEATSQDNYLGAAAFFAEMKQGMAVSQAIDAEKAAGYGTSKIANLSASMGFLGDGSDTLQKAASFAPPTVAPTAGPANTSPASTAQPAQTAAAAPTSTPVHITPLPLLAVLKSLVTPGRHQTINVQSSPNTPLSFLILFPNGDHRSRSLTTDARGNATFSFLQHPSKITHSKSIALVQIEAGSGASLTTITRTYRIGWSRIDVSVEPREQAVHRMIFIWVHSQRGQQVTVELRQPHGKVQRLSSQTGSNGWTLITHRLGRHLKPGNKVTVVAETTLGQKLYWTVSSFHVKA